MLDSTPKDAESLLIAHMVDFDEGPQKAIFPSFFNDFLGRQGGRASGRLDHGLKNPPGRLR